MKIGRTTAISIDSPTFPSLPYRLNEIVPFPFPHSPLSTRSYCLMETFAADLLESVPATGDGHASPQDSQSGVDDGLLLKNSSLRVRLDRLSGLRIHADNITFDSSEPHCGGKAKVVKATLKRGDGADEQQVAVKKLRYYDDINGRKFGNEFVHEVDVMAGLSHENIVKLIGFVESLDEGQAWIVLSWEPNGNISEFLATGEWEIPERVSLIQDTFAGIEYLHTRQPPICHGDLKSLNILVSASYRAVITDFGSARILKEGKERQEDRDKVLDAGEASAIPQVTDERIDRTRITVVASNNQLTLTGPAWSLRWAAPEVALGSPQSLASDVWATGWICWEIMTNKVPFPELNSEGAIVLKVVEGQVPAAREDAQLSQVIMLCSLMTDCWAFDPRSRPNIGRCHREAQWMPSLPPLQAKTSVSNAPSARLLCQMGWIHRLRGNCKPAIELFQQALSAATSGDPETRINALLGLGGTYYLISKDAEAKRYLIQANDICTQTSDDFNQAHALDWLGKVYHRQSHLDQAEESYIQARNIYSRMGSDEGRANTLHGLGAISRDRSQYDEAEEYFNQARQIYSRIRDDWGEANTLHGLGELYHVRAEYVKTEEVLNQALDIYFRIGDNLGRANINRLLGDLYHVQDLNSKAAPLYAEARTIYAQIGDSELVDICSDLLDVVSKGGDSSITSPVSVPGNDDVPSKTHSQ